MKFENMVVSCSDFDQKKSVENLLIDQGFSFYGSKIVGFHFIYVVGEKKVFTDYEYHSICDKSYSYQQFMDKYAANKLKQKVEQVKSKIGYKYLSDMSVALGYDKRYLSNTLAEGCKPETEAKIIDKLDALLEQNKQELTHDFKGKALNKKIDDAMMISKSELDSLKKEIDHKTQVAEKHADMRAKAEEKMLLAEQDSEKWQGDYWVMARENATLANELSRSNELAQAHFTQIEGLNQVIENGKFALDGANSLLESNRKTYVKNIESLRSKVFKLSVSIIICVIIALILLCWSYYK